MKALSAVVMCCIVFPASLQAQTKEIDNEKAIVGKWEMIDFTKQWKEQFKEQLDKAPKERQQQLLKELKYLVFDANGTFYNPAKPGNVTMYRFNKNRMEIRPEHSDEWKPWPFKFMDKDKIEFMNTIRKRVPPPK